MAIVGIVMAMVSFALNSVYTYKKYRGTGMWIGKGMDRRMGMVSKVGWGMGRGMRRGTYICDKHV